MVTHGPKLDLPLADGLNYPPDLIDTYAWETELGDSLVQLTGEVNTRKVWREPVGVVGVPRTVLPASSSTSRSKLVAWPAG